MAAPLFRGGDGISQSFDGQTVSYSLSIPQLFVAKITATGTAGPSGMSSPPTGFTWTEQEPTGDGLNYQDKVGGRTGTLTQQPAFDINGGAISTGTLVFMRERCFSTALGNQTIYDVVSGGGSGAGVKSVQCVSNMLVVAYS